MPSVQMRSSPSVPPPPTVTDLKQRVIACLNRLSDRDTQSLAAAELDSIALNLSPESFSLFINCLQTTDSSSKPPVRKHCVSLISVLSRSHGDSLSPHLPKMVSTLLRRLRDPDSSVRAACAAAYVDMTTNITEPSFSVLAGPMIETLIHDCDHNAQIGASLCLAAAVDAADDPDAEQLQKALPKIGKLLKSEGFKAKPELLGAIGSVIGAIGGRNSDKVVLDWLLPNVLEFLSSDDWHARKAAAEAMARVAMAEEELAPISSKLNDAEEKPNHSPLRTRRVLFPAKPKLSKVKENGTNKSQVVAVVQSSDEEENSSYSQRKSAEEELSLIRNQITRIEKQQSSLLDLFQRFMESSQDEMQSLGRRVRCLETSFSVLSTDLLVSRTITQNGNHKRNTCLH